MILKHNNSICFSITSPFSFSDNLTSSLLGPTAQADGGGTLQSILVQLHDVYLGGGGDVWPGVVRHAELQAVRAGGSSLPDAELTRALVQTEQPEKERKIHFISFLLLLISSYFHLQQNLNTVIKLDVVIIVVLNSCCIKSGSVSCGNFRTGLITLMFTVSLYSASTLTEKHRIPTSGSERQLLLLLGKPNTLG